MPRITRRPTYASVAATAALVLAAGGVGWAATLPKNSVGSPQIRNGAVRSIDLRDGGVRRQDLAPGAARLTTAASTAATFGTCPGGNGWCFLESSEGGSIVARLAAAPAFAASDPWQSTGPLVLAAPAAVAISGEANLYNPNGNAHNVFCAVYDGATRVMGSHQVKLEPNTSATVAVVAALPAAAAGAHDLTLRCRSDANPTVAVRGAGLLAIAQEA